MIIIGFYRNKNWAQNNPISRLRKAEREERNIYAEM